MARLDVGLRPFVIVDKLSKTVIDNIGETVVLVLEDGRGIKTTDLQTTSRPQIKRVPAQLGSVRLGDHFAGQCITVFLAGANGNLKVNWQAILRDGANYVRQFITLKATSEPIRLKTITMVGLRCRNAGVVGTVAGSPVVAEGMFFAYEHPNSQSIVGSNDLSNEAPKHVQCSLTREMPLEPNQPLRQSSVIGVAWPGQMRRAFTQYIGK